MRVLLPLAMLTMAGAWPLATMAQAPMINPEAPQIDADTRRALMMERLAYRPDGNGVASALTQTLAVPGIDPAVKARAEALRTQAGEANRAGRSAEALRLLYQGLAIARGEDGTVSAFADSLTLDPAALVVDHEARLAGGIRGVWPQAAPADGIDARFLLVEDKPGGATVAELGKYHGLAVDMTVTPLRFSLDLGKAPAGHFRLIADISSGGKPLTKLASPIDIVDGLQNAAHGVATRLDHISGHEVAKATIAYPFSLITDLNRRQREVVRYDYAANIARSQALLASLEAGKDELVRATGDMSRARYDAEAGTIIPYRIYVPKSWDGKQKLPLVIFLHGSNLDENDGVTRGGGLLARLAEERGYIVADPLGYRMNSAYGAALPADPTGFGAISDPDPRRSVLSEKDVLAVTDLVAAEYGVDLKRVYLMGNSMGGMGTWHLGAKYASRWAAISPSAGGVNNSDFDYRRLKAIPIRGVGGELDGARLAVQRTVKATNAAGGKAEYVEVPGGTHGSAIETAMPQTFDFFAKHRRR